MGFDYELDFEEALIKLLKDNGWTGKMLNYPTEAQLIKNWAEILFNNNKGIDRLNGQPLTDGEMQQILDEIKDLRTPLAINGFINGKSVSITRDNPADTLHFGKEVSLTIYNRLEIASGRSFYQIARQPKFERHSQILPKRRGDLVLLINGMPVIHVELKSSKMPAMHAVNQITEKYIPEGVFTDSIFSLVQLFVAMNPEETMYFANPGIDGKFNKAFCFHWADSLNNPINDWRQIASTFLSIPMAHMLIGFYTVADQADGVLKVLRSYQYYAASKISSIVAKWDWKSTEQKGGYVWHTTGSGKTMTSFKSAQLIAQSGDADKVVFLVDRIELGTQSLEEYRSFADSVDDVQATENTDILIAKMRDDDTKKNRLIVTSIQKMSKVNAEEYPKKKSDIEHIAAKRMVFIIDECHRSTFGDMLIGIKRTFSHAVFFGFTGTPINNENQKKLNTTQTIFGEKLHTYSIANGIIDKNVLGFYPYMCSTYKDKALRRCVALEKAKAQTEEEALADEDKKKVYQYYMNPSKVAMAGKIQPNGSYLKGIEDFIPSSQYNCDKHHLKVVEDIKENWVTLSLNSKFHALLATESIPEAIAYYRLLRKEMPTLKVTALFDPNIDNTGGQTFKEEGLIEVLEGYKEQFGKTYTMSTHAAFKQDVALRLAHKKPYNGKDFTKDKQIDLLIVVNQMLTGFDSKWINTLYVDKVMEYENIIQAFSRTNRLFGPDKPFGVIRYYRYPNTMKRNIDKAVAMYSDNKPLKLFADPLTHNLQQMNSIYTEIEYLFVHAGIKNFEKLPQMESERGRFVKLFNLFNKHLEAARIQGFLWKKSHYHLKQPQGGFVDIDMLIDEETYKVLLKRYQELLKPSNGGGGIEEPPYDIETYLTEIETGQIDADFINERFEIYLKLINKGNASEEERQKVMQELHKSFALLSQEEQKFANIFLHDVESGDAVLDKGKSFHDYIVEYMNQAKNAKLHQVAEIFGIKEQMLKEIMSTAVTPDNLNSYNRFSKLKATIDKDKAKLFFKLTEGVVLPPFRINQKTEQFLRDFILSNGDMDIPEYGRKLSDINEDVRIVEFADTLMAMHNGISVLLLEKECIERFGEEYSAMSMPDWFKVIYDYMKTKTHRYDLKQDDIVYWNVAEDRTKE